MTDNSGESRESTTLLICTDQLEIALSSDREIMHFLNREGLIKDTTFKRVNNLRSSLIDQEKSGLLVSDLKDNVKQNHNNYDTFLTYLRSYKRKYRDIVKILDEEYERLGSVPGSEGEKANSDEKPRFTDDDETKLRQENKPGKRPEKATPEYHQLERYCKQIQIILQTVNDHEYYAAITYMKPPRIEGGNFTKAMQFGAVDGTAIGEFAGKKVALIQTDPGVECNDDIEKAIKSFPNAKYLMGIGVCYSLDRSKHKLGDVLISTMIKDLNNFKFLPNGQLEDRSRTIDIRRNLREIFCRRIDDHELFEVAEKRNSKAFSGTLIGDPHLYNDKVMVEKLKKVAPVAIGGEMEGGQLLKFRESEKLKGVIIIKGVCDYADGSKSKEWQFTAAMAAFNYAESKLSEADSFCDDDDEAEVHEG